MKHTKDSQTWLTIRANTGHFFSPDTLSFFNSRIYWHTLTETNGGYLFITSEDTWNRQETRFSIRFVNRAYEIDTISGFGAYETLADAKQGVMRITARKVGA